MVGVMGHVKKSGQLSFSDINKRCVLIVTGSRILREKAVAQPLLPGNSEAKSRRLSGYHKCSLVVFLYCIKNNLSESIAQHWFSGYYSTCIKTVYVYAHLK